jgi:hypothetical protein
MILCVQSVCIMRDKINYANCMQIKCEQCRYYDYCFRYKPKKENESVFKSKIKEIKKS